MAKNKKKKKSKLATQEQLVASMRQRYGTQTDWATATVYLTAREVEQYYGKRCKEYEPLCGCCEAWLEWNRTGKVTLMLGRDEVLSLMNKCN
jgi:hypothetical protein